MEFSYYLSQTPISQSDLLELVEFDASSTVGDFSSNISSNITAHEIDNSSGVEDFTFIITFSTLESGAQVLLSNCTLTAGFTVGLTSGNLLFIDSPFDSEFHVFKGINLGIKNCICIQKSGNIFNVYKFDLKSDRLESSESYVFSPVNNLNSGSEMYLGGNGYYVSKVNNSVSYLKGVAEQWCLFSNVYELSYLMVLIQGFQPKTLSSVVSSEFTLLDSSIRFPDSYQVLSNTNFITDYFNGINSSIINASIPSGSWIGSSSGHFNPSTTSGIVSLSTGLTNCYGSGEYAVLGYNGTASIETGRFYDTIHVVKKSGVYSISHALRFSGQSFASNEYRIDSDYYYKYQSTTENEFGIDSSYYTGFLMNGVVSDDFRFTLLGTDTGNLPSSYNNVAVFDNVSGKFYLSNFLSGRVYFNGTGVPSGGYTNSNGWIDIDYVEESEQDRVTYDHSTGLNLVYAGIKGFATGDFYPNASIVFSGDNSYTSVKRVSREFYKETSVRHLYHASEVQGLGQDLIFTL